MAVKYDEVKIGDTFYYLYFDGYYGKGKVHHIEIAKHCSEYEDQHNKFSANHVGQAPKVERRSKFDWIANKRITYNETVNQFNWIAPSNLYKNEKTAQKNLEKKLKKWQETTGKRQEKEKRVIHNYKDLNKLFRVIGINVRLTGRESLMNPDNMSKLSNFILKGIENKDLVVENHKMLLELFKLQKGR